MAKSPLNPHRGSDLREFLATDGLLEETDTLAWKKAVALQLRQLLAKQSITKTEMAARMKTSRAAVERLLDESNPSVTLTTLNKAALALNRRLSVKWVSA